MINKLKIAILILLFTQPVFGQKLSILQDSISTYFKEIKVVTENHQQLWNQDIYGPILLVDDKTRQVYSNVTDSAGLLKNNGKIFSGVLPDYVNIANTSIHWNGIDWAMIMLPLPDNEQARTNLIVHELFHRAQPSLGFKLFNPKNNHLDQMDGRVYLRLEMEALKKVIKAKNESEKKIHLTNALICRKYRHSIYPGADTTENFLELNEGLAEFTGVILSGRNKEQIENHFEQSINSFLSHPSFVRSFAYQTIPVYGYLLNSINKNWNKEITINTNLIDYFIRAFKISLPQDAKNSVSLILNQYEGQAIISEETERDEKRKTIIKEYKNKYINQPHLNIELEDVSISFDPRDIMPIEDKGTFYPAMRATDNWGILESNNGALLSSNWDKISVTVPTTIAGNNITGDGWSLVLNEGYSIEKEEKSGNYKLMKK